MKPIVLVMLGLFTLFGAMNVPGVPVPVRTVTHTLVFIPSITASCLTYWYYASLSEAKYTVMTTATKSLGTLSIFRILMTYIYTDF